MILNIPWTKTMLEKFIDEALLTEEEEKILRTRVAGWSIVKQSLELGLSTATISRIVKHLVDKYKAIQPKFPDIFPPYKESKYEQALNTTVPELDVRCAKLMHNLETQCGKDIRKMTVEEIIECQKRCTYDKFYK
jgi:hypothetical protein